MSASIITIHDVFRPFYRFGKLLGFFCYTFDEPLLCKRTCNLVDDGGGVKSSGVADRRLERGQQARTSVRNVVLLLVNVSISVLCMLMIGQQSEEMPELRNIKRSVVLDRSLRLTFRFGFVSTCVTYVLLFVHRFRLAGIVCSLARVDEEMRHIDIAVDLPAHRRIVVHACITLALTQCFLVLLTSVFVFLVYPVTYLRALSDTTLYIYSTMTYSTLMSTYALALFAIRARVERLNARLRQLDALGELAADRSRDVQRIGLVFEQLCDISATCNLCFALPIMASVLLAFGYNVVCAYTILKLTGELTHSRFVLHVAVNLAWNLFFSSFVLLIVYAGSMLAHAGRGTGQAVHWALNTLPCWPSACGAEAGAGAGGVGKELAVVRQQLLAFSQQVLHKQPVASAGLFHFDWTLIYAMIATSGTYLVIMVQFDTSMASEYVASNRTSI